MAGYATLELVEDGEEGVEEVMVVVVVCNMIVTWERMQKISVL